jgi:PDZ domain-containing protein
MMFALGIIDTLTPGELNGGDNVAGTGTITADGTVGPIGGIRQKMWGARDAGAEWFLAPASNCDEVVGHIPGDLRVFSVEDLDDALAVLDAVREGGELSERGVRPASVPETLPISRSSPSADVAGAQKPPPRMGR